MGKRSRLAAECYFHKFFLRVEDRGFPKCPATWRRWRFHPEPPMTCFLLYEYRSIPPLHRHHIEPVPEYSNVGAFHHLIAGQSVFHLYDHRPYHHVMAALDFTGRQKYSWAFALSLATLPVYPLSLVKICAYKDQQTRRACQKWLRIWPGWFI